MLSTPFTELLGCRLPLQQAPMGGVTTPELVAAAAGAGAVGMVPAQMLPADELAGLLEDLAGRTDGVVGVTFLLPFGADPACVEVAAAGARLVDFYYGDPDPALVARVHDGGALASWQAGSVAEARAAVDAGCDLVAVQGMEGGGRIRGRVALLPLLAEVLDAVEVPVVAAGGIATARGVAACLAAGASAARVGTRLLATEESGAHPAYVAALLAGRGRGRRAHRRLLGHVAPRPGAAPHPRLGPGGRRGVRGRGRRRDPHGRDRPSRSPASASPAPTARPPARSPPWSTTPARASAPPTEVVPAAQVIADLATGAERLLRRWG